MQTVRIIAGFWDAFDKLIENTSEVNELLEQGWIVKNMIPMGGAAYGYASSYKGKDKEDVNYRHAGIAALVLLEK